MTRRDGRFVILCYYKNEIVIHRRQQTCAFFDRPTASDETEYDHNASDHDEDDGSCKE